MFNADVCCFSLLESQPQNVVSSLFLFVHDSVIFVNENKIGEKRENNEFVNEN